MKGLKVQHLVAIAALCWLVLIGIQVKWILDSRSLIEEQFDQKVSLALCAAVSSIDSTTAAGCTPSEINNFCQTEIPGTLHATFEESFNELHDAVGEALAFYNIHLEYRLSIAEQDSPSCDPTSPYCCAISPFEDTESAMMNIAFPHKNAFLLKKIWWMLAASIFILLFVLAVFILALRALIHQKRISQWNIDFFNNMAHEFRTPLTNIQLAMQRLVKRKPELDDDPFVGVVRREDAKLGEQIDRILGMATLSEGQPYLERRNVDIQELLRDTLSDMELPIQAANATVNLHLISGQANINGDPFHLKQAFRNLLDNALKYTENIPQIDIRVRRKGQSISVTFEDNGIGIPAQNREMIFERFHRAPNGNRHDHKGFGLGLSYVKTIIEDHRGTIRAIRNAHSGSQFELILPTV